MPPVLGPRSASKMRLWSWAGGRTFTRSPSTSAMTEASGPESRSTTTRAPAAPWIRSTRMDRSAASAVGDVAADHHALAGRRPSAFTTTRPSAARAWASAGPSASKDPWEAVGMPAAAMTSLAKSFDPSRRAAAATRRRRRCPPRRAGRPGRGPAAPPAPPPRSRCGSPPPSARAPRRRRLQWRTFSATRAVPGLPGAQNTFSASGLWPIFQTRACSRPPPPTTRIRIPGRYTTSAGSGASRWRPWRSRRRRRPPPPRHPGPTRPAG